MSDPAETRPRFAPPRSLTTLAVFVVIAVGFYLAVYWKTGREGWGNPHLFVDPDNLANMFGQAAMVGILASGMTLVIVSGHIDLSVGSLLGMLGAVAAWLMSADRGPGWPSPVVCLLVPALGAALGALHGWLIGSVGIPAFVVTLGGLLAYRGGLLLVAKSTIPVNSVLVNGLGCGVLPTNCGWLAAAAAGFVWVVAVFRRRHAKSLADGNAGPLWIDVSVAAGVAAVLLALVGWLSRGQGIPVRVLVMAVIALAIGVLAARMRFGRHVYAIGGNREAALYSGIRVRLHMVGVFALMGAVAGVAGLVAIGIQMAADPGAGDLMELYAIAACVIGGTSLTGGRGTVFGSILGALIMATIRNGLSCLGVASAGEKIVLGVILVIAVGADLALSRRRR